MHIAAHEWARPIPTQIASTGPMASLYWRLSGHQPDDAARAEALAFVRRKLDEVADSPTDLPAAPEELGAWMDGNAQRVAAQYAEYLEGRKAGGPRRFFGNRAHALYFLRVVAPTKLVDGSWLYGLVAHWRNSRFSDLVRTYVEELGEGAPDKNHVLLYRKLLASSGLDPVDDLDDAFYEQGLIQLALGWHGEALLPEVIGFNLGYEQLPLHLLITAYELNELGLDPYYFTLHVTVDNTDTGHAKRACQAVLDTLPKLGDSSGFWERVRNGSKLADAGLGTTQVIREFDIAREVVRILSRKSVAGHGAHSDYCKVAGRSVNDWLAEPSRVPGFLEALQQAGWIHLGRPVDESRFWGLLQGEKAEMFGVFSSYELQVIHDWIRGAASADGQPYADLGVPQRASFRAAQRLATLRGRALPTPDVQTPLLDPDLDALEDQLRVLDADAQMQLLVQAMSPVQHWTPAGLKATRLFWERSRA
ncbi:iron-containing redox enzyme family protein [Ramlibacter tataouinensis]|uniref:Iron-containing redox enzyme family protein n=1 Tax=Ramlibacter tataouinensis (strain ATCC BAA-407 / DSM 14655 / LMG 21543 / TTB310) TaxID=365046 RepID=F5XYK4_RAMTT|nr:iron-containing redox enzyme family protein [Ramlibacter tataouinensis]AEG93180.1 conserved hypothetical protein [Ramlibacter tataouinensis TTB310]